MNLEEEIERKLQQLEGYKKKKYLLGVSAGVDSMVLLSLFKRLDLYFEVAHINYQLRRQYSEHDEALVKKLCKEIEVKFHLKKINTLEFLKDTKSSLQMFAREIRYDFFTSTLKNSNLDFVVTAHHLDDQIETFFINLSRGTGIEGLTGIKFKSNQVIRPLLSVSKSEIYNYAEQSKISYREDESNKKNNYKRNLIRNKIVPLFKELNPSFQNTMKNNMGAINTINDWANTQLENELNKNIVNTNQALNEISIKALLKYEKPFVYLYNYLNRFGFNSSQVKLIEQLLTKKNKTGKRFFSKSHELTIDRENILLTKVKDCKEEVVQIKKTDKNVTYPFGLSLDVIPKHEIEVEGDTNKAFIDLNKIEFPLKLRRWSEGDTFQPLGMTGKKKVSDFLIDNKLPLVLKQDVFVLVSNGEIIWIVGQRLSEKVKITSSTSHVLLITKT